MPPPHKPIADVSRNTQRYRTSRGKDGQFRHDMGEWLNLRAAPADARVKLMPNHSHCAKNGTPIGSAGRSPFWPRLNVERHTSRLSYG
jgi:hypothetical protein